MPLIQWIMQNLQVLNKMSGGVEANGSALIEKLVNITSTGGVLINGNADSVVIAASKGVDVSGAAGVTSSFNIDSEPRVVLNGAAATELIKFLSQVVTYLPGDTVYLATGEPYIVQGFYYDITKVILYEIFNGTTVLFVEESQLKKDREAWLFSQLSEADKMIALLGG